jgi:hypothetical protein
MGMLEGEARRSDGAGVAVVSFRGDEHLVRLRLRRFGV